MAKKRPISEQLREAIRRSGKTRYRISLETGISESILSRFVNQGPGCPWPTSTFCASALGLDWYSKPNARARGRQSEIIGAPMASLSSDKGGNRLIQFARKGQGRGTLRLGKVPLSTARKVKGHVEELIAANRMQQAVEPRTAAWVAALEDEMAAKLAAVDLIAPRGQGGLMLWAFLDRTASRIDVKPATK